jgi:UDP-glucose 4-epimerase
MTKKPTILISGVAGFVGSNLAERLVKEGYPVVGIDSLLQGVKEQVPKGVIFHNVDIRSRDILPLFKGADVVFHLAAKNSLYDCQQDPVGTMDINVVGTANVFNAARLAHVRKVVYAQSSVLEEGEARLKGFYAISKLVDEKLADGFNAGFGLTTVGLRYFNVYGPRQDYRRTLPPIMSKFIITLLKGEQPVLFEGDEENRRDFVHVDDINVFHLLCIEDNRVDNRVFRIGSGKNYSIIEILAMIQNILGTRVTPIHKPRLENDSVASTLADITDARALGWKPKVSLEEGLRSMVTYIRCEMAEGRIT